LGPFFEGKRSGTIFVINPIPSIKALPSWNFEKKKYVTTKVRLQRTENLISMWKPTPLGLKTNSGAVKEIWFLKSSPHLP
jgi:hypothetical protein